MARASRRPALVDAAGAVIAAGGLAGLTTKAVAERAGVSEAALYYHFRDKLDLVLAVVERNLPALCAVMQSLPEQAGSLTVAANLPRPPGHWPGSGTGCCPRWPPRWATRTALAG